MSDREGLGLIQMAITPMGLAAAGSALLFLFMRWVRAE